MVISSIQLLAPAQCLPPGEKHGSLTELSTVREAFPILKAYPGTIFFDNAATAQKALPVLEEIEKFNRTACANAGRGAYSWSTRLSAAVDESRVRVANFMNTGVEQIAFTHGATDSLNMVAMMWGLKNLNDGDEVMLCMDDHASSVLPWYNVQELLRQRGISVNIVPFTIHPTGTYDRKSFKSALSPKTRIVCLSHIHHLYGMEMDIAELRAFIPEGVLLSLDASQSVSHIKVNCQELGADFISFSGHKMFAGNGVGVLWASRRAMREMWPIRIGAKTKLSSTGGQFDVDRTRLSNLVECGTLNLPGILSLRAAVEFIQNNGIERMGLYISALTLYLLEKLKGIDGIEFAPGIGVCECTKGFGIISFKLGGIDSADVGAYLDSEGIFVKTGDQCLGSGAGKDDYVRVSLQIYNTAKEIDRFVEVLNEAVNS